MNRWLCAVIVLSVGSAALLFSNDVRMNIGHSQRVLSVDYSPDGSRLATGAADATVRIWDSDSRREINVLGEHYAPVEIVTFFPDGDFLASAANSSSDTRIIVWNPFTGEVVDIVNEDMGPVEAIAFSPDGLQMASVSRHGRGVALWDLEDVMNPELNPEEPESRIEYLGQIASVEFTHDGSHLLFGTGTGQLVSWDINEGEKFYAIEGEEPEREARIVEIDLSPDGTQVVSATFGGEISIHDVNTGEVVRTLDTRGARPQSVAYSPDGEYIAAGFAGGNIRVFNSNSGTVVDSFSDDGTSIVSIAISPDNRIAYPTHFWETNAIVFERTLGTGRGVNSYQGLGRLHPRTSVVTFADGSRILSGTSEGHLELWDASSGKRLQLLAEHDDAVRALSVDPNQDLAVSATNALVQGWDLSTTEDVDLLFEYSLDSVNGFGVGGLSILGRRLVIMLWGGVAIMDLDTGEVIDSESPRTDGEYSVAPIRDDLLILAGEVEPGDAQLRLWDLTNGELRKISEQIPGRSAVAVAADSRGERVVSGGGGMQTLHVWDVREPEAIEKEFELDVAATPISVLDFSPDDRYLYHGTAHGVLSQWDVSSRQIDNIFVTGSEITDISTPSDASTVVTAGADGSFSVWRINDDVELLLRAYTDPDGEWLSESASHGILGTEQAIRSWVHTVEDDAVEASE